MKEGRAPFFRRAHLVVFAVAAASFLASTLHLIFEEDLPLLESNGADGFSESAIGHKAFLELLATRGVPFHQSRYASAERTQPGDVLLLAEPTEDVEFVHEDPTGDEPSEPELATIERLLIVLPRWEPSAEDKRTSFPHLNHVVEMERWESLRIVGALLEKEVLQRLETTPAWHASVFGVEPDVAKPQLLQAENLRPLVACDEGILVGELEADDRRVVIVADPTPFQNHGIWRGENAALVLALVDSLRDPEGAVIVDETSHGFELVPSVLRELFRRPLLGVTLHALAFGLLVAWAALARFGRPLTSPRGLVEGKQALLDNVAELLGVIGAMPHSLRRYLDSAIDRIVATRHPPPGLERAEERKWLAARLRPHRAERLRELQEEVKALGLDRQRERPALLALARRIHAFRTETMDGTG